MKSVTPFCHAQNLTIRGALRCTQFQNKDAVSELANLYIKNRMRTNAYTSIGICQPHPKLAIIERRWEKETDKDQYLGVLQQELMEVTVDLRCTRYTQWEYKTLRKNCWKRPGRKVKIFEKNGINRKIGIELNNLIKINRLAPSLT